MLMRKNIVGITYNKTFINKYFYLDNINYNTISRYVHKKNVDYTQKHI